MPRLLLLDGRRAAACALLALVALARCAIVVVGREQSYTLEDLRELGYEPCQKGSHLPASSACSSSAAYFSCGSNGSWLQQTCAGRRATFNRLTCSCDVASEGEGCVVVDDDDDGERATGERLREYADCCRLIRTVSRMVFGRTSGKMSCGRAYLKAVAGRNSSRRRTAAPSAAASPTALVQQPPDADSRLSAGGNNSHTDTAPALPMLIGFGCMAVFLAAVPAAVALCYQFSSKPSSSRRAAALSSELDSSERRESNDYYLPQVTKLCSSELLAATDQAPSNSTANSPGLELNSSEKSASGPVSHIQETYYSCTVITNETADSQEDADGAADSTNSNNLGGTPQLQLSGSTVPAICCPSLPYYFVIETAETALH